MNTESRTPIDFYFDFSSPYSYIANEWIDALAARHGRVVRRRAILLGVTFQAAELKSPVSYPIKRDYALRDFARSARFEGLPYLMPSTFPIPTQNAARVFWWLQETQGAEAAAAWTRSAFRAFFTRDIVLSDPAALRALLAESGVDAEAAEAAWSDPVWKDRLKQANEQAIAAGVFGAPFFVIDGEPFWGNDRKLQMERWLGQGPY
ncbi:2-hydroxychromene-2-carboxylate isomerase [Ideonella dechloratans]|uniref:2-hydroxychromene-2-carboxylate isomerase n=1 Tax=Ideonella dechloratans TaxID=36863 RepID=A0A643FFA8_IDEDE|nr:2-hydroxychromene-2-carboxylate isomerase [Ideonella dechloratans]KAB0583197.1 2-hydroxychromene-2-carboxylate isomerase [Ideonella dechloratans]UFU10677.1 2-hydroxychromene-2-carboxylate isomerase [Ideonella dechloratans]